MIHKLDQRGSTPPSNLTSESTLFKSENTFNFDTPEMSIVLTFLSIDFEFEVNERTSFTHKNKKYRIGGFNFCKSEDNNLFLWQNSILLIVDISLLEEQNFILQKSESISINFPFTSFDMSIFDGDGKNYKNILSFRFNPILILGGTYNNSLLFFNILTQKFTFYPNRDEYYYFPKEGILLFVTILIDNFRILERKIEIYNLKIENHTDGGVKSLDTLLSNEEKCYKIDNIPILDKKIKFFTRDKSGYPSFIATRDNQNIIICRRGIFSPEEIFTFLLEEKILVVECVKILEGNVFSNVERIRDELLLFSEIRKNLSKDEINSDIATIYSILEKYYSYPLGLEPLPIIVLRSIILEDTSKRIRWWDKNNLSLLL